MKEHAASVNGAKSKKSEKDLSRNHCAHDKFHTNWPGTENGTPLWQAGDQPPESRHGPTHVRYIDMHFVYWRRIRIPGAATKLA